MDEGNYVLLSQIQLCGGEWTKPTKNTGLNILWGFCV